MAKKTRRRLGHITPLEVAKAENALLNAYETCQVAFSGRGFHRACWKGVEEMEHRLHASGFTKEDKGLKRKQEADAGLHGLGDITEAERDLLRKSSKGSKAECAKVKPGDDLLACSCGVEFVESELGREFGFSGRISRDCTVFSVPPEHRHKLKLRRYEPTHRRTPTRYEWFVEGKGGK